MPTDTQLAEMAGRINDLHRQAETSARRAVEHAVAAGKLLLQAKDACGHGQFGKWIKANCEFSQRTAQTYMWIASHPKAQRVAHLSLRDAIKALAEPKKEADATEDVDEQVYWEAHEKAYKEARNSPHELMTSLRERLAEATTIPELLEIRDISAEVEDMWRDSRRRTLRVMGKLFNEMSAEEKASLPDDVRENVGKLLAEPNNVERESEHDSFQEMETTLENVLVQYAEQLPARADALRKIRDEKLWQDGFCSFPEYCQERANMDGLTARRIIKLGGRLKRAIRMAPDQYRREIILRHQRDIWEVFDA